MNATRAFSAGLFALALVAPAFAQDKSQKVVPVVKKGEVTKYKVIVNTSVMGMDLVVTQSVIRTVKELKENGDIVFTVATKDAKISIGGMEQDQPDQPDYTETQNKLGLIVAIKAPEAPQEFMTQEVQNLSSIASSIIFSAKPVKEGDSWETTLDNPVVKGKKYTVKTKVLGAEKVEGKVYWKYKQSTEAETGDAAGKFTSETVAWIDPETGLMFQDETKVTNLPTMVGPLGWTMKSSLVKGK